MTTQHERDQETGFDYRGARFYDSDIARFLSLDPLATEFPSWSAYNYVMGNPISLTDPTGKSPEGNGNGDDAKKKAKEKETNAGGGIFDNVKKTFNKYLQEAMENGGDSGSSETTSSKGKSQLLKKSSEYMSHGSTALGITGAQLESFGKAKSLNLYNLGHRRGIYGNYQLTGRNLSLFKNIPSRPSTLPITGMATWGNRLSKSGGYIGAGAIALETIDYSYNPNTTVSGGQLSYHIAGFATSVGVGYKFGGPAGALVGGMFSTAEVGYDTYKDVVAPQIKQSYNRFNNNMMSNFFKYR